MRISISGGQIFCGLSAKTKLNLNGYRGITQLQFWDDERDSLVIDGTKEQIYQFGMDILMGFAERHGDTLGEQIKASASQLLDMIKRWEES